MKKNLLFVLLAAAPLMLLSCSNDKSETSEKKTETVDLAKVKVDIQAMEDAYAAAEKAKNPDAVLAYYADDAVSYHRNEQPYSGKAAIKQYFVSHFAKDTAGNSNVYKVVDLFAEGNHLVEVGSWSEMNPAGAEVDNGYYISYFQKRDGKYVCVRDMSMSAKPAK